MVAATDGNLWFTENRAGKIGMIDPRTHVISEFAIPTASSWPWGIGEGPDQNIWFAEAGANRIGMLNPGTHEITEFTLPGSDDSGPQGITAGPDGMVWFTEGRNNKVGMIDPTTHAITEFHSPTQDSAPWVITAGPNGKLWFLEYDGTNVGEIDPTTDTVTDFTPLESHYGGFNDIVEGADGKLWGTEPNDNRIGVLDPTTHVLKDYSIPTDKSIANLITEGPRGNLWFTESDVGRLGMINPTTHAITEYPVPYTGSIPDGITEGPDGNIWFTDAGTNAIGVDRLATTHLVVTQQPPSSVTAGTPFGLTVQAQDSSGKLVASFHGTVKVTLANNPGGAKLRGQLSVAASGGVATFSGLSLTKAASGYTLVVASPVTGSTPTNAFKVIAAAAQKLVITQQPSAQATAGVVFTRQPIVKEEDRFGNVIKRDSTHTVTAARGSHGTAGLQGSQFTVTLTNGVASFSGLYYNQAETMNIAFTTNHSGVSSATSSDVVVSSPPARPGTARTVVALRAAPPATTAASSGDLGSFSQGPLGLTPDTVSLTTVPLLVAHRRRARAVADLWLTALDPEGIASTDR
jgi:streptogramin lyase